MNLLAFVVIIAMFLVVGSKAVSVEEDLSVTNDQRIVLEKFRELMRSRLPHDYMLKDIYLIRWLRISGFDIAEAESKLLENLEWRKENKMDEIIFEDWTDFEARFPYFLEGCDVDGRPFASAYVGEWDIRGAFLAGQGSKLLRYSHKLLEEITVLIRLAQSEGKNVTQFGIILNMNNFNLVVNACPLCVPFYITMLASYELHYPGSVHKAIIVNTPPVFHTLLNTVIPFVPKRTRDLLVIYGRNRSSWQSKLNNDIPKDQLTFEFGGTKDAPFEPEFLRKVKRLPC